MVKCIRCGNSVSGNVSSEWDVTCGTCVQRRLALSDKKDEARLGRIDPADAIAKRKAAQWTQRDLAVRLNIPIVRVAAFEQGRELCPREVAEWMGS